MKFRLRPRVWVEPMHHELFEEMQRLIAMDPSDTTDAQEDRLAELLALHDSGETYLDD